MMRGWIKPNHHVAVAEDDFKRLLRFPLSRELEGPLLENATWAREWFAAHARPWSYAVPAAPVMRRIVGARTGSFGDVMVVAVSAGVEAEREAAARWAADEPDRYFFLESYASAMVEALLADARRELGVSKHFCPGYRHWPVEDNVMLADIVHAAGTLPGPLEVMASGMIVPKKSQLAVCVLEKQGALS
jgi:hypothetical protein